MPQAKFVALSPQVDAEQLYVTHGIHQPKGELCLRAFWLSHVPFLHESED